MNNTKILKTILFILIIANVVLPSALQLENQVFAIFVQTAYVYVVSTLFLLLTAKEYLYTPENRSTHLAGMIFVVGYTVFSLYYIPYYVIG